MTTQITKEQLTDETLSAWKAEALISLGETPKDIPEYSHHEAILALVTEIQERRKAAAECHHQWRFDGANKLQKQKQCVKCGRVELSAPLAPVVPDTYVRDEYGRMALNGKCEPKIGFAAGWNACRAAMLQAGNSPAIPDGWTGSDEANAALIMLDRIETVDSVDDDRIEGIKRIIRWLAAAPQQERK